MNFLKHTISWCKGEIFEGRMILLFGLLLLFASISFWRFGNTPISKTFIIPTLVCAVICIAIGINANISNNRRIVDFTKTYNTNAGDFVRQEKARTENFIKWYPNTRYGAAITIIICLIAYIFSINHSLKSIALCLIIMAFALLVIDYFSEQRAMVYHNQIEAYLNKN